MEAVGERRARARLLTAATTLGRDRQQDENSCDTSFLREGAGGEALLNMGSRGHCFIHTCTSIEAVGPAKSETSLSCTSPEVVEISIPDHSNPMVSPLSNLASDHRGQSL